MEFLLEIFCTSRNVFYVDCSFCIFLELLVGFEYFFSVAVGAALVLNEFSRWNLRIYRNISSVHSVLIDLAKSVYVEVFGLFNGIWWTFRKTPLNDIVLKSTDNDGLGRIYNISPILVTVFCMTPKLGLLTHSAALGLLGPLLFCECL